MRLLAAGLLVILLSGCVERSLTITSEPPGARVYLDSVPRGFTPLTLHFPHYGTRKVVLEKRDYHRSSRIVTLEPPWYEKWGLSFFADVIWPGNLDDNHRVDLVLIPINVEDQGLETRARAARRELGE